MTHRTATTPSCTIIGTGVVERGRRMGVSLSGGAVERQTLRRQLARKPTHRHVRRPKNKAVTQNDIISIFLLFGRRVSWHWSDLQ